MQVHARPRGPMATALSLLSLLIGCPAPDAETTSPTSMPSPEPTEPTEPKTPVPDDPLFAFLAQQQGPTGLLESFVDHEGLPADFRAYLADNRPAFAYDSALAAIAWLGRGAPDDLDRARAVLDGFLSLQRADGAVPSVVHAQTGVPTPDVSSGNQAWVLLALLSGHDALGDVSYLLAAERVAAFLLDPAGGVPSTTGFGAITLSPESTVLSTEHNLDAYPAFTRLAAELPTSAGTLSVAEVQAGATRSRLFAESRFDPQSAAVFAGSTADGRTTFRDVIPLDTHSWALLSLGRLKWVDSYRWALQDAPVGLWTTSSGCPDARGPSFSDADTAEVWTEGLAQMHTAALRVGDATTAAAAEATLDGLRRNAPVADGQGLVATCTIVDTGFGSSYFDSLAVGATAWAAIAAVDIDPYWFVPLSEGLTGHPAADLPTVRLAPPSDATFDCAGAAPCLFAASGTTAGVVGTGRAVYLLVEPLGFGSFFTQAVPASVASDGSFTVQGQLGSDVFPVQPGDRMRLLALVTDGDAPPSQLSLLTPATVSGVVSASGVLLADVRLP